MKLLNKIFLYGLTFASLNSLSSCNKESTVEVKDQKDYLAPLIGTWRQIKQNSITVEYIVKKTFNKDMSYSFSIEDPISHNLRAFRASIDDITIDYYKAHITSQYGNWSWNFVGDVENWKYYLDNNSLYENDGNLYNIYRKE